MKIENVKIEKLIPYEFNNKIHDETQVNRIANSIREFGFLQPLVIDKNNVIIVWHGRFEASQKLWLKDCPCVRVDDLTEEQIKKFRILDNKLNESAWNEDNLKIELQEIKNFNIWELEIKVEELFPDLEETEISSSWNSTIWSNKEITPDDLWEFQHKCPACWFEFNDNDENNDEL